MKKKDKFYKFQITLRGNFNHVDEKKYKQILDIAKSQYDSYQSIGMRFLKICSLLQDENDSGGEVAIDHQYEEINL